MVEPVRNQDHDPILRAGLEPGEYLVLRPPIQRGKRIIQHEHRAGMRQRPRQCQPLRLIGVALTDLTSDDFRQMSLFENTENHEKQKKVDGVVDDIRKRFGNGMIVRGSTMKTADKVARKAKAQMDLH